MSKKLNLHTIISKYRTVFNTIILRSKPETPFGSESRLFIRVFPAGNSVKTVHTVSPWEVGRLTGWQALFNYGSRRSGNPGILGVAGGGSIFPGKRSRGLQPQVT